MFDYCDNKCECKCKCECCKGKFHNEFKNKCEEKKECKKCEYENYDRCECFCRAWENLLDNLCNARNN